MTASDVGMPSPRDADRAPDGPTHLVTLRDGRRLALDERGPADGQVVLFLHPAPGSRLLDPDPAVTARRAVRLFSADRPGYGASSPPPSGAVPTLAAAADDLAEALSHLAVGPVGVVGWSSGGRVALALAARHPGLVRAVTLVATPAPDEQVRWIPDGYREALAAMRAEPSSAMAMLTPMLEGAAPDVGAVAAGADDEAALARRPDRRGRLIAMLQEGQCAGAAGAAADIIAVNVAPGADQLDAVTAPVSLFYGEADDLVPAAHGRWWAEALPNSRLVIVPGIGHLVALTAWDGILTSVCGA
jgi:pimeloyl-ACP methyl ester carboxylesterase